MNFDSQKKIISENNPIDYIEEYVLSDSMDLLRDSKDELTVMSKGIWRNYNISFKWDNQKKVIEINSYFDISRKIKIKNTIYTLISDINKKAFAGFFNFCPKLNTVFFCYKISFKGQNILSFEQIKNFIDIVTNECDRFFPVFFVFIYKKINPSNSLDIALVDTYGEA